MPMIYTLGPSSSRSSRHASLSERGKKVVIKLQDYPTADEFDKEEYMIRPPALGLKDDEARSVGFHRLREFMLRGMIGCDGASTIDDLVETGILEDSKY